MKFTTPLVCLISSVAALPANDVVERQSLNTVTDQLLFSVTLPQFTSRRDARDPASLDWTSDGCTSSPDNPFGFYFVPGCNRHDFGYQNYRAQSRFTVNNKASIDSNFKDDLYYLCESESPQWVCEGLAEVYYAAVRAFGGDDATGRKAQNDLVQAYEDKVAIYDQLVVEAQASGDLPILEEK